MAQLFTPRANTIGRLALLSGGLLLGLLGWLLFTLDRSPYTGAEGRVVRQPILFSHALHVGQVRTDCRYCHAAAGKSSYAGMPSTHTCMSCHSEVATDSPLLQPVRESYREGTRLAWNRVHALPDTIYFDHSIHVQKGVGCESCHGRVDQMPLVWQAEPLTMAWCLECHRDPAPFLRPQDAITLMGWEPATPPDPPGLALQQAYHIRTEGLTDCSTCHR